MNARKVRKKLGHLRHIKNEGTYKKKVGKARKK